LSNEQRPDAFWIGNASGYPINVHFRILPPRGAQPNWLRLSRVPWTDTAQNQPVATALLPISPNGDDYALNLPAGMMNKIWLDIYSTKLLPGIHHTTIIAESSNHKTIKIPLTLHISPISLPRHNINLSMWDYTDREGLYGITTKNLKPSIDLMRAYGIDIPWGSPSVLPQSPSPDDFDADNKLIKALDFSTFDEWVNRWPGAHSYAVFVNQQGKSFAGTTMGTPAFDARVGAWARALAQHMRDLKLKPQQLILLMFDEPGANEHNNIITGWLNPIKAAAPELTLFSDPVWPNPNQAEHQGAFTLPNILSPNLQIFLRNQEISEKYYGSRLAAGQSLWFYECSAAARLTNPTGYFRFPAWLAFRYGVTGLGFWSFGDIGGATSSWNEYVSGAGLSFSPAFLGQNGADASIQLEAIREGLEDYEMFRLLRTSAANSQDKAIKQTVSQLLSNTSIDTLCADPAQNFTWLDAPKGLNDKADAFRNKAYQLLTHVTQQKYSQRKTQIKR
jgi:hypothetical protein